ncbi:unnamed protein product [Medioppia subpectinata]|uniref:Uncharacterized protein n=1 Tax=Medioppia subpectinata TaxID=1979941 RepID=A0A7R9KQV1_9ACAR|nr:unnamed protein product [Medioppia subpectinata]CAG2107856.1 unnamed protein product [Medioppia subpectinata]
MSIGEKMKRNTDGVQTNTVLLKHSYHSSGLLIRVYTYNHPFISRAHIRGPLIPGLPIRSLAPQPLNTSDIPTVDLVVSQTLVTKYRPTGRQEFTAANASPNSVTK